MDHYLNLLTDQAIAWLPRVGMAVLILLLFWLLVKLATNVIRGVTIRLGLEENLSILMLRSTRLGLWILGLITTFGTLGVDVTAMVAGLGLTGFALGFALKDTVSNLLSGVLILLYRPFTTGDTIGISGFEGRVISIDMRYTVIQSETDRIFIPNSKLFTDPLSVRENTTGSTTDAQKQ